MKIKRAILINILIVSLLAIGIPVIGFAQSRLPEAPRATIDTTYVAPTGRIISVPAGANLQTALDSAQPTDVVELPSGANFVGNFALKFSGVMIRWAEHARLQIGKRVLPTDLANAPKIISPNNMAALYTIGRVNNIRIVGVEVSLSTAFTGTNTGLVRFGDGSETTVDALPKNLIIDRCYIHATSNAEITRGVALNCGPAAVIDSYISDIHSSGFDAQCVAGWNGNGPFKLVNNFFEGSGENVMFGGEDSRAPELIPADIEIRRNEFFKPLAWRSRSQLWKVKNLFELKCAKRVIVEGNTFTNNWGPIQGYAINIKSANQGGGFGEWSTTEDVLFINNIVRSAQGGINVSGPDENTQQTTKRVKVANNLFYDIDGAKYNGSGNWIQIANGVQGVEFAHNTAMHTGKAVEADLQPSTGFIFRDNITPHNLYGIKGSGQSVGIGTLNFYFPGHVFRRNVVIGGSKNLYPNPDDNTFVPDIAAVGFRDIQSGDFRVRNTFPLGTDGKVVGADLDAIAAAMAGTPSPSPGPGPSPAPVPVFLLPGTAEIVFKDASGNVIGTVKVKPPQ